jgi:hypothetical protein
VCEPEIFFFWTIGNTPQLTPAERGIVSEEGGIIEIE